MNSIHHPPQKAIRFLRWFCDPDILEDLEGDLLEIHQRRAGYKPLYSNLLYWRDIFKLLRPGIIRNFEGRYKLNNYGMIKNYFKSAWRNLLKHKRFSAINITSLSLGIAACIVIYLFVQDERSFDSFHSQKQDLYRLCEVQSFPGTNTQKVALSMPGMGPTMLKEFPEIKSFTRFWSYNKQSIEVKGQNYLVEQVVGVDSTFLKLFDFPVLAGDPDGPAGVFDAYLTESTATRIFGSTDIVGQQFKIDGDPVTVTGIIADVPQNSHLQFDILCNIHIATQENPDFDRQFGSNFLNTYFLLNEHADLSGMADRFPAYLIKYLEQEDINEYYQLFLQPLEEVHLSSTDIEHDYNNHRKFNGTYLDVFLLIGIFILIIATVNFMNLTTARASHRAKEIGVRKTIGARKRQLFFQFILESILLAFIAFAIALILDFVTLPFLNDLIGRDLALFSFVNSQTLWIGLGVTLVLGIIAGIYPALYLASFKSVLIIKGIGQVDRKSYFRSSLIVLQFGLAISMIVCTLVVVQQLMYMKNKDIGYNTDHILLVNLKNEAKENYEMIKQELLTKSNILGVTASGQRIGNNFHQWGFKARVDTGILQVTPSNVWVDYDYLDVYGIELLEGRSFSREYSTDDGLAFIINKAFAEELGFEDPIGKRVGHGHYPDDSLGTIIGVTDNFNFNSLHYKVNTLSMVVHSDWGYNEMSVKLNGQNINQGIREVAEVYSKFVTDYPFDYEFLDDHFEELYRSDQQMGITVSIIAVLSILIGSMGLFGLAAISIDRRIKEIGIRKVLGASGYQLWLILSKNFMLMILLSFVLAAPVTWLFLADWLEGFAYRISVNPLVFLLGAIGAFLVALITISYQVLKTARINPIDTLRYE